MANHKVWTGLDAYVKVYVVDKSNNRIDFFNTGDKDTPAVNYCFFQNCSFNGEVPFVRRPVTGRATKRILRDVDEWDLTVEHFYLSFEHEFDPLNLFSRDKRLELTLFLQKPENADGFEELTLIPAFRVACNISGQENGIFVGSGKFASEAFNASIGGMP